MESPTAAPLARKRAGDVAKDCVSCGACRNSCRLLREEGLPSGLFALPEASGAFRRALYRCSLCGRCDAVCPRKIPVTDAFRAARGRLYRLGLHPRRALAGRLFFERLGMTKPFRAHLIPPGADTALFPGCNLPGIRPEGVLQFYKALAERIPRLGVVFDCCGIFTRDAGDEAGFARRLEALAEALKAKGIRRIVSACPTCLGVFREAGFPFALESAQEHLPALVEGCGAVRPGGGLVLHDPCSSRHDAAFLSATRRTLATLGVGARETGLGGAKTFCCAETGLFEGLLGVGPGERVLTSCAGCLQSISARLPAAHLFDVCYPGADGTEVPGLPRQFLNRARLARRMRKLVLSIAFRERPEPCPTEMKS